MPGRPALGIAHISLPRQSSLVPWTGIGAWRLSASRMCRLAAWRQGGKAARRRRDGCEAGEIWVSIDTILSLQPETVMPSAAKTLDAIGELAILSFGASGPLAQRQSN